MKEIGETLSHLSEVGLKPCSEHDFRLEVCFENIAQALAGFTYEKFLVVVFWNQFQMMSCFL